MRIPDTFSVLKTMLTEIKKVKYFILLNYYASPFSLRERSSLKRCVPVCTRKKQQVWFIIPHYISGIWRFAYVNLSKKFTTSSSYELLYGAWWILSFLILCHNILNYPCDFQLLFSLDIWYFFYFISRYFFDFFKPLDNSYFVTSNHNAWILKFHYYTKINRYYESLYQLDNGLKF